jgi:hypothetical protein
MDYGTSPRRRWVWSCCLVAGLCSLFVIWQTVWATPDPLQQAWQRARAAGSYHFSSDVTQHTIPVAKSTNIGRQSRTERIYLAGKTDLRAATLEMRLWSDGGSVGLPESGQALKVENGQTFVRQGANAWQASEGQIDGLAPGGDFLSYLAAVRDVRALPPETRGPAGREIAFTRYAFTVDGPTFALFVRDQMAAAMRAKGQIPPPGVEFSVPAYYRDMTGTGELWVRSDGLPLRQILDLRFPEQQDQFVQAQITVDFSDFGQPRQLTSLRDWGQFLRDFAAHSAMPFGLVVPAFGFMLLVLRFYRTRQLYNALALAVGFSLVGTPLLNSWQTSAFLDAQRAQAASAENTLGSEDAAWRGQTIEAGMQAQLPAPNPASLAAPNLQATDPGTDRDGDGLTDFMEERLGTDPTYADSDDDGLPDGQEVRGFDFGGQHWATDPHKLDSNDDGLADALEWDRNGDNQPDDTDGDGVPDLFDDDNDGDGVPDRKDSAPNTRSTTLLTESNPFQLTIHNLTAGQPTFVDFQLRPQNPSHLWYAFNVLDWPMDDTAQWRDIDGKTFADFAASTGNTPAINDAAGDMKLIPMLEIRIGGAQTNLPPQSDLTPYNISVNELKADGSERVVYVPLTLLTDEENGQRVAFIGRMRYLPTGNWPTPHVVRLAWVVQALMDIPCDPSAADAQARGCQTDGYIHNAPQAIQTYYDDWTLTGLSLREDHGTEMAVIYKDPAVDPAKQDDAPLWALTTGLDNSFLAARDQDNNGARDITLAEIARRFDRTRNNGVNDVERWAIPNILRVAHRSYPSLDQAVASTAMTETTSILQTFNASWTSDQSLKPLLLFAREERFRSLGLGGAGPYVTLNGASLVLDLQPAGQAPLARDVLTGLKWMPYCAPSGPTPAWAPCTADAYWEVLDQRGNAAGNLPEDDANNSDLIVGRNMVTNLYALSLMQGVNRIVQSDTRIVSGRYSLLTDSELEASIRSKLNLGATAIKAIANKAVVAIFVDEGTVVTYLGRMLKELRAGAVGQFAQDALDILRSFRSGGNLNRLAGTGIVAGVGTVIAGFATLAGFYLKGELGAKIAVQVLISGVMAYLSIIGPIKTAVEWAGALQTAGLSTGAAYATVLRSNAQLLGSTQAASLIGTVLFIGITWGFFVFSVISSNLSAFSPEFNRALAEAIATTIYLVVLAVISSTVIGTIIVGIIAVIDGILTAICELGVDWLRNHPGLGGACFTIGTASIKIIAKVMYSFDVMVNTSRDDLVVTGAPILALSNPNRGYVTTNPFALTLPVTTTIVQKDPDPTNWQILFYQWFYTKDNLRSSTFRYSLTQPQPQELSVKRGQMAGEWQNVTQDHKWALTTMYRARATGSTTLSNITLPPGINRSLAPYFNLGYAIPAYECWSVPNLLPPFFPQLLPVCYTRTVAGNNSTQLDALKFDILPASIEAFMSVASEGDGGLSLTWDASFPSLYDADGDGLAVSARGGLDPNDASPDADGDGLTDAYELNRRAAGLALSPIQRDTDGDGLTDAQELQYHTNPAVADSDGDGLSDSEEVWHRVAGSTTFAGGWDVTVAGASTVTVRVSSDPNRADSDRDGVNDLAERTLALSANPAERVDRQGRPYHPNVFNLAPLAIYPSINDADGFLARSQNFVFNNTVMAYAPMAPGVLDVTIANSPAAQRIASLSRTPVRLDFDPLTFSGTQTVTQQLQYYSIQPAMETLPITLNSTARTRLASSDGPAWAFDPVNVEAPLGGFTTPPRKVGLAPYRLDRTDSYLLAALTADSANYGGRGDIWQYRLPTGEAGILENDGSNVTALHGTAAPNVACNQQGACLAVWEEYDNCNQMTVNWLKVVSGGSDPSGGIEPNIYFTPQGGSRQELWYSQFNGGNDMTDGEQRGPNALGFPITRSFCGGFQLEVQEVDGGGANPLTYELVGVQSRTQGQFLSDATLTFSGNGHTIELNVSVPVKNLHNIAAAYISPNGTKRTFTLPAAPLNIAIFQYRFRPVVASNGDGFLVASELAGDTILNKLTFVMLERYDRDGVLIGQPTYFLTEVPRIGLMTEAKMELALIWTGVNYEIAWRARDKSTITIHTINAGGEVSTGTPVVTDAALDSGSLDFGVAYDPLTQRRVLVYRRATGASPTLHAQIWDNSSLIGPPAVVTFADGQHPRATWHPGYKAWLLGWTTNNNNLNLATMLPSGNLGPYTAAYWDTAAATSSALSCPAPDATPLVDLRFEELPGAQSFVNSAAPAGTTESDAKCTPGTCPQAGVPGAPRAVPASDYALEFSESSSDVLTLRRPVQDDFTIAFWLKTTEGAGRTTALLDAGFSSATGFGLALENGQLRFAAGSNPIGQTLVNDNQWHFVTATRQRSSGQLALYVDGTLVATGQGNTNALNSTTTMNLAGRSFANQAFAGTLDHLQIFGAAMAADTVKALYDGTMQSYCVAASANGAALQWAKVKLRQPDYRGGVVSAQSTFKLTIDVDVPSGKITSLRNGQYVQGSATAPNTLIIGGEASDPTSSVAQVDVRYNGSAWNVATGTATWSYPLLLNAEGEYNLLVRATDVVGNVGQTEQPLTVIADGTAPNVTLAAPPSNTASFVRNEGGVWQVTLNGTVSDPAVGARPGSGVAAVEVRLTGDVVHAWQRATLNGNSWTIRYALPTSTVDPTGRYQVDVRAVDAVGNQTNDTANRKSLALDLAGPLATIQESDATRGVLTDTVVLSGQISDTISGIAKLEVAFALASEVLKGVEPATLAWHPATLANSGAGVLTSGWTLKIPANLEGEYQIGLRTTDVADNVNLIPNAWRGVIDTRAPRVVLTVTPTGATYSEGNRQRYALRYICAAQDRYLDGATFQCPGENLPPAISSFDNDPILQQIFPDFAIRSGLAISYTRWELDTTPTVSATACDIYGHCGEAETVVDITGIVAALAGEPKAVVIQPTDGSVVAAPDGKVAVTIAAEAAQGLQQLTLTLDGVTVDTATFAPGVTNTQRQVTVTPNGEGKHTVVATATDHAGTTQAKVYPIVITVDKQPPALTIDASTLTISDTYGVGSGILRFNGTTSDSVGLASVQLSVDNGAFADVRFGNGIWQTAQPVNAPEGRTLFVQVQATDFAGQTTVISQSIGTALTIRGAPETQLTATPEAISKSAQATFTFQGQAGANELSGYRCQLDAGLFAPCTTPHQLTGLSDGRHSFHVRAVDVLGNVDPSPASFVWIVDGRPAETTILSGPASRTNRTDAEFTFRGDFGAASFECAMDNGAFVACSSPKRYVNLGMGAHNFQVRARDVSGAVESTPAVYNWTITADAGNTLYLPIVQR